MSLPDYLLNPPPDLIRCPDCGWLRVEDKPCVMCWRQEMTEKAEERHKKNPR